jgi:hypothetical protein
MGNVKLGIGERIGVYGADFRQMKGVIMIKLFTLKHLDIFNIN